MRSHSPFTSNYWPVVAISSLLLLGGCGRQQSGPKPYYKLNDEDRRILETEAEKGDADAAWTLFLDNAFTLHDDAATDRWLRRAAQSGHAVAQRTLAEAIAKNGGSWDGFGDSKESAIRSLLEKSVETDSEACLDLAEAYAAGDFGTNDFAKARAYLIQGAKKGGTMCWGKLAEYLHKGIGGPKDDAEAYYWASVKARCTHPESFAGQDIWKLREEIDAGLTLPELEKQWERVDQFIERVRSKQVVLDLAPFNEDTGDPAVAKEGRKLADKREKEYRENLRRTGRSNVPAG
jgi:hypothetical protein